MQSKEITTVEFNVLQMSGTVTQAAGGHPRQENCSCDSYSPSAAERKGWAVIAEFLVM